MRAVFKYPGSKWSIASWIIDHFPVHHSYLEPFFGSGAVLFHKPKSKIETVNDLDKDVVNFFECVRSDPDGMTHEINHTPYSRYIYEQAVERIKSKEEWLIPDPSRAVMFAAKMTMGFSFRTNEVKVGFKRDIQGREAAYAANDWCKLPERFEDIIDRLRGVQIENRPAVQLIREFNYPNVLIYADPPYVLSSRSCKRGQYKFEMTDEDHEELLDTLLKHKGPVVISGYQSSLYESRLKEWRQDCVEYRTQRAGRSQEVIWMNYDPPYIQGDVFDVMEGVI